MSRSRKALCLAAMVVCLSLVCGTAFCADSIIIGGYWENWMKPLDPGSSDEGDPAYYAKDIDNINFVYYSFLTLARQPDPYSPPAQQWDGQALYESMTQANVIDVMTVTDPAWKNPYDWQRVKIQALIDECRAKGKKFVWAIGGWSDLTQTVSDDQVSAMVSCCVTLLKSWGDGIDFDWEHLSDDPAIMDQQRRVLGKILPALRKALDDNGLSKKLIGYTTRLNAFWNDQNRPSTVTAFTTDGEGIDIAAAMAEQGSSFKACADWVNIMMYDMAPSALGESGAFTLGTYQMVLTYFEKYVPKNKIVMGFEPGGQVSGGIWEGMEVDQQVIDYIKVNGYGGVMFWAINQPATPPSTEVTGENAQRLAGYAKTGALMPNPDDMSQVEPASSRAGGN